MRHWTLRALQSEKSYNRGRHRAKYRTETAMGEMKGQVFDFSSPKLRGLSSSMSMSLLGIYM